MENTILEPTITEAISSTDLLVQDLANNFELYMSGVMEALSPFMLIAGIYYIIKMIIVIYLMLLGISFLRNGIKAFKIYTKKEKALTKKQKEESKIQEEQISKDPVVAYDSNKDVAPEEVTNITDVEFNVSDDKSCDDFSNDSNKL